MQIEGFTPYDPEAAELFDKRRWWLGLTLGDMFDKASDVYPSKEALVGAGKRYTYGQLRILVDRLTYQLLQEGLKPGDRGLLQLPNWLEFVIAYFALQKSGLVMVLLTVNHTAREISHLANLTQPKGWILPDRYRKIDFLALIEQVKKENPLLGKVIIVGEDIPEKCLDFADLLKTNVEKQVITDGLDEARPDPKDVCQNYPPVEPQAFPREHPGRITTTSVTWNISPGPGI